MLATVSQTRSLAGTYYYDRALNKKEKGGHVIASNGIPQYSSAKTQLAYMQAYCSDKYQVKAINIVLSHSSEDKEILEANPKNKDKYVTDFLQECQDRGIDLENTPWIIMEHINTDCDHYHMILLTTKFDGSRLDTGFIGKRASKAAWAASKKNGLHFAKGLELREQSRLKFIQKELGEEKVVVAKSEEGLSEEDLTKLQKVTSQNRAALTRAKNERRAKAIAEANERKARIKGNVEFAANYCLTHKLTIEEFSASLAPFDYRYGEDEKGNYIVTASNGKRDVTYKMKNLGIDTSLIDSIKNKEKERQQKEEEERKAKEVQKQKEAQRQQEAKEKSEKERQNRPHFKFGI